MFFRLLIIVLLFTLSCFTNLKIHAQEQLAFDKHKVALSSLLVDSDAKVITQVMGWYEHPKVKDKFGPVAAGGIALLVGTWAESSIQDIVDQTASFGWDTVVCEHNGNIAELQAGRAMRICPDNKTAGVGTMSVIIFHEGGHLSDDVVNSQCEESVLHLLGGMLVIQQELLRPAIFEGDILRFYMMSDRRTLLNFLYNEHYVLDCSTDSPVSPLVGRFVSAMLKEQVEFKTFGEAFTFLKSRREQLRKILTPNW